MTFFVPELDETVKAKHRPMVIITSNAEKDLPDAFLRRCVFHYIQLPTDAMRRSSRVSCPASSRACVRGAEAVHESGECDERTPFDLELLARSSC